MDQCLKLHGGRRYPEASLGPSTINQFTLHVKTEEWPLHSHALDSRLGSTPNNRDPEGVERAALEAFAVEARDELWSGDAPVERGVAAAAIRDDGAIQPRGPLYVRAEEAGHGDPRRVLAPVRQDPVLHALEPVVADKLHPRAKWIITARWRVWVCLKKVADVDDQGAGKGRNDNPAAVEEHLQAAHAVLQEDGEEGRVGVPAGAEGEVRLRARRLVVARRAEELHAAHLKQVAAGQTEGLG
ncbi:hypothetical protein U9M48_037776 [Paspalum notatum var. saurae]|uniref:Uncharacterized protein n=1 Tax=Paspalum notatum var. saurae TaxID=547442 RepID=A0AAQ3XCS3_PASNO